MASCGLDRFLRIHHLHNRKLLNKVGYLECNSLKDCSLPCGVTTVSNFFKEVFGQFVDDLTTVTLTSPRRYSLLTVAMAYVMQILFRNGFNPVKELRAIDFSKFDYRYT